MIKKIGSGYHDIEQSEIDYLLQHGDFSDKVRKHSDKVVVIMTQDWCHEWAAMLTYLPDFVDQVSVFVSVYNLHPQFEQIMEFKENTLGNRLIPYLRYYYQGQLITTANFLPRNTFAALLTRTKPFTLGA